MSNDTVDQGPSSGAMVQPYSCLQCKHRKVKCDRIYPCFHCRKDGAGAACVYRPPPPPKRRKRGHPTEPTEGAPPTDSNIDESVSPSRNSATEREDLLEKVRRYEALLKDLGALRRSTVGTGEDDATHIPCRNHSQITNSTSTLSPGSMSSQGRLIANHGKSRFLENRLWTSVTEEFHDPGEILEDSSEDESAPEADSRQPAGANRQGLFAIIQNPAELVFSENGNANTFDLKFLHPHRAQIILLWQAYLDNVNPLVKILHAPTTLDVIMAAADDLGHISKATEALLFGIYVITVASMSETQCQSKLGESKARALKKFGIGAQQALRRAGILKTSDMTVLQAFVLYLLSARLYCDAHSLWSLTGMAIRIGQRIGLHRDGETLNLPPFETEMRRRLWLILFQLDSRAAELCGSGLSIMTHFGDTRPPLNVHDSDIYPDMTEPPAEREKPTEMIFVLIRAEVGRFLTRETPVGTFDGVWSRLSNPAITMVDKDRSINQLAQLLEEKVRHCDEGIPVQRFALIVAKASVCKMRLLAHLPRGTRGSPPNNVSSSEEEDLLFTNSLQVLEYDTEIRITRSLWRFLWHVDMQFQWHALIYLLTYLHAHPSPNARTDAAWKAIEDVFAKHKEISQGGHNGTRSKLCIAVGNLTLKAWEAREIELRRANLTSLLPKPPACVRQLRKQRGKGTTASPRVSLEQGAQLATPQHNRDQTAQHQVQGSLGAASLQADPPIHPSGVEGGNPSATVDATTFDWEQWDSMCQEFAMQDQWWPALGSPDAFSEQQQPTYSSELFHCQCCSKSWWASNVL